VTGRTTPRTKKKQRENLPAKRIPVQNNEKVRTITEEPTLKRPNGPRLATPITQDKRARTQGKKPLFKEDSKKGS